VGGAVGDVLGAAGPRHGCQPRRQEVIRRPSLQLQQTDPACRKQLGPPHRQNGPQTVPAHRCGEYRPLGQHYLYFLIPSFDKLTLVMIGFKTVFRAKNMTI
jgi:hypothetical protein